jgi:hypothetical protein
MKSIWRFYADKTIEKQLVKSGLTEEQARKHCHDPESSSKTATLSEAIKRTEYLGAWFEGMEEE